MKETIGQQLEYADQLQRCRCLVDSGFKNFTFADMEAAAIEVDRGVPFTETRVANRLAGMAANCRIQIRLRGN